MSDITQALVTAASAFVGAWLAHRFALRQAEHGTRFQRQYERRDEVIGETWRLLLETNNGFHNWASPFGYQGEPSKVEQGKEVYGAIRDFVKYYRSHMLWFDQQTLDRLNRYTEELSKRFHALYDAFENEHAEHAEWKERFEARRDAWHWAREEMQEWVREIEGDFRRSLASEQSPWWRSLSVPRRHRSPGA